MYNMEKYCTRLYCIENPYWTRHSSNTDFQYNTDSYNIFLSILYITLNNNLLLFKIMENDEKYLRYLTKSSHH